MSAAGLRVVQIAARPPTLEEVFRQLVHSKGAADAAAADAGEGAHAPSARGARSRLTG